MRKWLMNFAYRIKIEPGIFIYAGILTGLIAFMTISFQSIKASTLNPAETLKYE